MVNQVRQCSGSGGTLTRFDSLPVAFISACTPGHSLLGKPLDLQPSRIALSGNTGLCIRLNVTEGPQLLCSNVFAVVILAQNKDS